MALDVGVVESKPLFGGQQPQLCGHYYPDAVWLYDHSQRGKFFRIVDCLYCGEREFSITSSKYNPHHHLQIKDISAFRVSERQRLVLAHGSRFVASGAQE